MWLVAAILDNTDKRHFCHERVLVDSISLGHSEAMGHMLLMPLNPCLVVGCPLLHPQVP